MNRHGGLVFRDSLEGVKGGFGCEIGCVREFGGIVTSKVPQLPCDPDLRLPFPPGRLKVHAQEAGPRATLSTALILLILRVRSFAQIEKPVIVANPIDVICLAVWPFSC